MNQIREYLFRCLDDCENLVTDLRGAKSMLINDEYADISFELLQAETKLNKIIENFELITKEFRHNGKKDP